MEASLLLTPAWPCIDDARHMLQPLRAPHSHAHSRECEANAMMLASEKLGVLDFNTAEEKDAVDAVFSSALEVRLGMLWVWRGWSPDPRGACALDACMSAAHCRQAVAAPGKQSAQRPVNRRPWAVPV